MKTGNLFQAVLAYEDMQSREKSGSYNAELQKAIAENTEKLQGLINKDEIASRVYSAMQDFFRNNGRS